MSSSIRPEFRSASIAICLPGIASRVNRAPTSATRAAPLVTTVSWITIRIANTTRPMISELPITMCPNASITCPAKPSRSTSRVALTFSASRNSVATSTTVGNTANSSGLRTCIEISSTIRLAAMLTEISTSSTNAGSGTTIITTTTTTATGTARRVNRLDDTWHLSLRADRAWVRARVAGRPWLVPSSAAEGPGLSRSSGIPTARVDR